MTKTVTNHKNILNKELLSSALILSAFFAQASAETWVRITVESDGVYGISHEELIGMGFSNPDEVAIVGRGGTPLSSDDKFYNIKENIVPAIYDKNSIYFFGKGPESYSFYPSDEMETYGFFANTGRNIYSDYGYYYLTDSPGLKKEMTSLAHKDPYDYIDWGVSFVASENDLTYNPTNTGNIFLGESFSGNLSNYSWEVETPDAMESVKGLLMLDLYAEKGTNGELTVGTHANGGTYSQGTFTATSSNLLPIAIPSISLPVTKGKETVEVSFRVNGTTEFANLDHWTLSYLSDLSGFGNKKTHFIAFPNLEKGNSGYFMYPGANSLIALEVSDPANPRQLETNFSGTSFYVSNEGRTPLVTFFDPAKQQKSIATWEKVSDSPFETTIAEIAKSGADFVIIAPEWLLPYSHELASIHEKNDGIKAAVFSIDDVYREFSGGLPDPESYRKLVMKFEKENPKRLANILLMGPFSNDIRRKGNIGIVSSFDDSRENAYRNGYAMCHIAPQAPTINLERGAYFILDYLVALNPEVDKDDIEHETLSAGIGMLPFATPEEAQSYIEKLRSYLNNESHSIHLNEWLFLGGTGDEHTHDLQCVTLNNTIKEFTNNSVDGTVLAIDAYGEADARKKYIEEISEGKGMIVYFGHSSNTMVGKNADFFTAEDVKTLSNSYFPFIITAGCSSTDSDMAKRGYGEEWVVGTSNGAIGGIISERETWSSQNYNFVETFLKNLTDPESRDLTIGEIYRNSKNIAENPNDNALVLMCDPALRLPSARNLMDFTIEGDLTAGSVIKLKGKITDGNGNTDPDFNGNLTIKLNEPPLTLESQDFVTAGQNGDTKLNVTYANLTASVSGDEVKNGEFTASILIPPYFSGYAGSEPTLYVSAFDAKRGKSSAAGKQFTLSSSSGKDNQISKDTKAPVISDLSYDAENHALAIEISDDCGLDLSSGNLTSGFSLWIDGNLSSYASLIPVRVYNNGKDAIMEALLPYMHTGEHTASIQVRDFAGNHAKKEISFMVENTAAKISLAMQEKAAREEASFIVGDAPQNSTLVIIDGNGKTVTKLKVDGNIVTWNCNDSNGNRLNPGLYKAYVSSNSSDDNPRHAVSEVIYVPLI